MIDPKTGAIVSDGSLAVSDPTSAMIVDTNFTATGTATSFASVLPGSTGISATGLSMVGFITGEQTDHSLLANNYWSWNGSATAPSYAISNGRANDWGAGTTVTYAFNPASNWTTTEMNAFTDGYKLWSAIANITFSLTTDYASTQVQITRGVNTGGAETINSYNIPGSNTPGTITHSDVAIDTTVNSFSGIGSYTTNGGYGTETAVHELGHSLGLGHPGPYNGTNPSSSQVLYATDTRQYTIMSYNDPTGNPFNNNYLTTPGQYDIVAAQRIYGAPTPSILSGKNILSGNNIFGFNSNTTISQYDFTVNTNPVVTLFDIGNNNTLDLSGFSLAEAVNLNPGAFSSVQGMTNDIGIDFNTNITNAIGGTGDDSFTLNTLGDTIDGGAGANVVHFQYARAAYTLAKNGTTITATRGTTVDTLKNVSSLAFTDGTIAADAACFTAGTRIATARGAVSIEALQVGDDIALAEGGVARLRWIGRRSLSADSVAAATDFHPVLIRAGAFGAGPARDLLISPDHALAIDEILVPARALVNGGSITVLPVCAIEYFHLVLDRHDIILAEGLAVESWLNDGTAGGFDNAAEAPEFAAMTPCRPIRRQGAALEAIRSVSA